MKTPLPQSLPVETRTCILDVAERLFAEHGLERVSIRDITQTANLNLGAINYHFGTKQQLIAAVFDRRLTPVAHERLQMLDTVEKAAGAKAPKLDDVLEAFIRPAVRQAMDPEFGSAVFRKLMGRCLMEANPELEALIHAHFEPLVRRFDAALMRVMPKLTREEVFWRMNLILGALHHSLLMLDKVPPGAPKIHANVEDCVQRLVAFGAAGFRVSQPAKTRKS
jgi:AcrR family transcriptional regulator